MKNIKLKDFTLKDLLQSIKDCATYNSDYEGDRNRMMKKIEEYLEEIE